jgi:hypothetical protein
MSGVCQNTDPHRLASVYPDQPLVRREDTIAGLRGGWGVNILEDARHSSVLYICKYFVTHPVFSVYAFSPVSMRDTSLPLPSSCHQAWQKYHPEQGKEWGERQEPEP